MEDKQVRRTIGDAEDEMNELMRAMNAANEWATYTLTMRGFRGDLLEAQCLAEKMVRPITEPHSLGRQQLLANAHTHGAKFFATGGSHATTDNVFKAVEIPIRNAKIEKMKSTKDASY